MTNEIIKIVKINDDEGALFLVYMYGKYAECFHNMEDATKYVSSYF